MLFGAMQYFLYRYTLISTEKATQMLENTMYSATAQVENMVGAITNIFSRPTAQLQAVS